MTLVKRKLPRATEGCIQLLRLPGGLGELSAFRRIVWAYNLEDGYAREQAILSQPGCLSGDQHQTIGRKDPAPQWRFAV
jgi:hypothetical protein